MRRIELEWKMRRKGIEIGDDIIGKSATGVMMAGVLIDHPLAGLCIKHNGFPISIVDVI